MKEYFAAHDDRSVFAVSMSRLSIDTQMKELAGEIGERTFEYDVNPCTESFYDYVLNHGTPARWIRNDDGLMDLEDRTKAAKTLGSISTPRKASASRENGKKGGRPKATVKCGIEYPIGTPAPSWARWAMWYHGYVRYFTTNDAAQRALAKADWHTRDNAMISPIS